MSYSKGFSFIEVILVMALSSIIMLVFVQNITLYRKFKDINPQILFFDKNLHYINRGLLAGSGFIFSDLKNSIGKRDCSIYNLEALKNIIIPPYKNLNHGEVSAVNILGNTLLIGMNSATSSDPDIVFVDTNDWRIISSLNTGPGISGMVLQGHYLYLANTSVNAQFQVIDISNPLLPILISSLKIPRSLSSNPKLNPIVTSITTNVIDEKARIFLGTQKSDLGEIFLADFNGQDLSYVGAYDTQSIVNDVFADEAGLWATSPSDDELFHYNASGTKDFIFNANGQSGNGKRIDIVGKYFKMLGRTFGHEELVQIDGPAFKIGGSINDLLINIDSNGKFSVLILVNINGSSLLQVWGTSGGKLDKLIKSMVLPVSAKKIACDENFIYVGTASTSMPIIVLEP